MGCARDSTKEPIRIASGPTGRQARVSKGQRDLAVASHEERRKLALDMQEAREAAMVKMLASSNQAKIDIWSTMLVAQQKAKDDAAHDRMVAREKLLMLD
jgi:hypothetical protein